jgi:uncharacterized XkdX family phage protein
MAMTNAQWLTVLSDFYNNKCYDNDSLKLFVAKGKITELQYKTITDIDYVAS